MPSAICCAFQPTLIACRGTTAVTLEIFAPDIDTGAIATVPKPNLASAHLFLMKFVVVCVAGCLFCFLVTGCNLVKQGLAGYKTV